MAQKFYFIAENSSKEKIKTAIVFSAILVLIIVFILFFSVIQYLVLQNLPFIGAAANSIKKDLINTSPIGLFYSHFIGGIFFVPSADEAIFYYGLLTGNPPFLSFTAALCGFFLSQILNYFFGSKISSFMLPIISKKKLYKTRRYVNKYGAYGIFLFNFLPFPSPLLTFALGIARYNKYRLFLIILISKSLEYSALILLFLLISK